MEEHNGNGSGEIVPGLQESTPQVHAQGYLSKVLHRLMGVCTAGLFCAGSIAIKPVVFLCTFPLTLSEALSKVIWKIKPNRGPYDPEWINLRHNKTDIEKAKNRTDELQSKWVKRKRQTVRRPPDTPKSLGASKETTVSKVNIEKLEVKQQCIKDPQPKKVWTGECTHSQRDQLEVVKKKTLTMIPLTSPSSSVGLLQPKQNVKKMKNLSADGLLSIFPKDSWYEKSKYLGKNKHSFIGDLLSSQGVRLKGRFTIFEDDREKRPTIYTERSPEQLQDLLNAKPDVYKRCIMAILSSQKAHCKLINPEDEVQTIEINGRTRCGQAFNNDEVVVQLLQDETRNGATNGEVVGVLRRHTNNNHPVFLCEVDSNCPDHLMKPQCKTVPKLTILKPKLVTKPSCENQAMFDVAIFNIKNGKLHFSHWFSLLRSESDRCLFWMVYLKWTNDFLFPLGAVVNVMDLRHCTGAERRDMLLSGATVQFRLRVLYNQETLQSTMNLFERISSDICCSAELMKGRENLTQTLPVFTIDPPGSKDLDDALSVQLNSDGSMCVGVHISDVSSFVKKDDPIDKEAYQRGTSHYPPDKVPVHMLPEPLSTNLLSLKEGQNRLTLSVFFTFAPDGKMEVGSKITKTAVRSSKQFTYQNVQDIIDSRDSHTDVTTLEGKVVKLYEISKNLRRERLGDGGYHCSLDWEQKDYASAEAHSLVEEFMLLANKEVASFLLKAFPQCTPLRCQSPPTNEQIQAFKDHFGPEFMDAIFYLQQFPCFHNQEKREVRVTDATVKGRQIPVQKWVFQLLSGALSSNDTDRMTSLVQLECLHPTHALAMYGWTSIQKAAEHVCSNSDSNIQHFSLGNIFYTQFTSPLRRYLDIIVHRLLHSMLNETDPGYKPPQISDICDNVNRRQTVAKSFSRCCQSIKLSLKLEKEPMNVLGVVADVTDEHVEFLNPFLLQTPDKVSELIFSKLGVCTQPEFDKSGESNNAVTLKWKKRLYDARGTHPHAKRSQARGSRRGSVNSQNAMSKLDPMNEVCQISCGDWHKLRRLVKCPKHERKLPTGNIHPRPPTDYTVPDVTSESHDGELLEQHCNFSLEIKQGQCISIQLSASPTNGSLKPEIQLCTVAPSMTVCMLHMTDPVKMFTKQAKCASKNKYNSVEEYQRTWNPIVDLETAANIIKDPEETIVINNLAVTMIKTDGADPSDYYGSFSLGKKFCEDRCIYLDPSKEEDRSSTKSMFVCIRQCPSEKDVDEASDQLQTSQLIWQKLSSQSSWIAHGQTVNVEDTDEDDYNIVFKLNHVSHQPREELFKDTGVPCTVELFEKGPGERRIEEALRDLKEGSLAGRIAKDYQRTCTEGMEKQLQMIKEMKPWMSQKIDELRQSGLDVSMWEIMGVGLPGNNINQRAAIEKAIHSDFSVIHGPPGTGKTFTAIKLVFFFVLINKFTQTMKNKGKDRLRQLLFCGPSNKSVDVVAKYLKRKLGNNCPKIVRVYGETIEAKEFPIPTKWISPTRQSGQGGCDPELKDIALHHIIRRPDRPYSKEIRKYDHFMRTVSPKDAQKKRKYFTKLMFKASVDEIKKYEVILCTTTCSSSSKVVEGSNVYQCIVDECGMCPEPECLVPLVSSGAKQVVLIGDHKQLQPIIMSRDATRLGLQKSLFERYAEAMKNQLSEAASNYTMLNIQYRMHPSICDFPSKTFYDDKLVTGSRSTLEPGRLPTSLWPGKHDTYNITNGGTVQCKVQVVFCHVEGKEETLQVSTSDGNENSKSNQAECDHVARIMRVFVQHFGADPKHINVMSQYSAQCCQLRQQLKQYGGLTVNTVVTSQGGEWDYVVFSLVRSLPQYLIDNRPTIGWCQQNLGFITDEHQVNVALTRARKGLVLIGNRNLLECHPVWKKLLDNYSHLGCLVEAKNFPSPLRQVSHPS